MKREGWFIVDDQLILGYRNGSQKLLKRTKKGIPSGAMSFDSSYGAEKEIDSLRNLGIWPLFIEGARVEFIQW